MADTEFHFSVAADKDLYCTNSSQALEAMCTPIAHAKEGDIIAVAQDLRYSESVQCFPITHFVVMRGDGAAEAVPFDKLREDLRAQTALSVMEYHKEYSPFSYQFMRDAHRHIDPGDGETLYTTIYMMPRVALLSVENYTENVFGRYDGEDLEQDHIDQALLVLVRTGHSAHQQIAVDDVLKEVQAVFNDICPVTDSDQEVVTLAMPSQFINFS